MGLSSLVSRNVKPEIQLSMWIAKVFNRGEAFDTTNSTKLDTAWKLLL
jgi:hypothetical protein